MTAVLSPTTTHPPAGPLRPVGPTRVGPPRSGPFMRRPALVVVLLMAVSAASSTFLLLRQSLRLDEAQSLWQASHSFGRMYQLVAQDVHVPLYHTVLRLWITAFGNGVVSARALSLFFFVLTIPAVYALARRVFDLPNALFAATLVALSPFLNWYGNEIRMYTLLALLTVLNQLFFVRILQRAPGANWLGYALTALAGIYTHYFFWLGLVTQAGFYVVNRRQFAEGTLRRLVGTALLLVAAIAPWLAFVSSQGGSSGEQPLLAAPTSVDLFNTFSQFLFGFQDDQVNTLLVALWPLAVLLALFALQKTKRIGLEVGYFLMVGLVPITCAFVFSVAIRPLYISRYLIIALPSLLLFLTWLLSTYGRRTARMLRAAFLVAVVATSVHQAVSATTPSKEDYRAASGFLAASAHPQDIVIISPPFTTYPFDFYYRGAAAVTTLPLWDRFQAGSAPPFDAKTLPAQAAQIKGEHEDAWLVLSYDQGYQQKIRQFYDSHYQRLAVRAISPRLAVYHYRLRYDIPRTSSLIESLNPRSHPAR